MPPGCFVPAVENRENRQQQQAPSSHSLRVPRAVELHAVVDVDSPNMPDVLIICALDDELEALQQVEVGRTQGWTEIDGSDPYWEAAFEGEQGVLRIVAACPTRMGGKATTGLAERLIERIKPTALAMCGVCAGHPENVDRGDVIIADRVFEHDFGKRKPGHFEADLHVHPVTKDWHVAARRLKGPATTFHGYAKPEGEAAQWWFLDRILPVEIGGQVFVHNPMHSVGLRRYVSTADHPAFIERLEDKLRYMVFNPATDKFEMTEHGEKDFKVWRSRYGIEVEACPYHVHIGPIGSGNGVEAAGDIWDQVTEGGMRRALGIEMEAAAIGEVAHGRSSMPFVVVKGVMDHADPKKSDRYKRFAARASAEVLMRLLRRVVVPTVPISDDRKCLLSVSPRPSSTIRKIHPTSNFAHTRARQVFIAYSGAVAYGFLKQLAAHLGDRIFDLVYDTKLGAVPWEPELVEKFERSEGVIALVDAEFLNSRFVRENEAPRLLARSIAQEIPVVGLAAGRIAPRLTREPYKVAIADGSIEQHDLTELQWVPRAPQRNGERHYNATPLNALTRAKREERYAEILAILLDDFDRRDRELVKSPLGPPKGLLGQWLACFAKISGALLGWSRRIEGQWIERPELDQIQTYISDPGHPSSTHLLLGLPGSGKSALLAELGHRVPPHWVVFALKADTLSADTESSDALVRELELPDAPSLIIKAIASEAQPCLVLIDQLDSLASLVEHRVGRLDVLVELIVALHGQQHVHVVASCRNFEHEHDPRLRGLTAQRIELELPDAESIRAFIDAYSTASLALTATDLDLLRRPQHLRLFLQNASSVSLDRISDPLDLLEAIANQLDADQLRLAIQLASTLGQREEQFLALDAETRGHYARLIGSSTKLVEEVNTMSELRFTHQIVFEYFWARAAVDRGLIETFVKGSQSTFVRPQLRLVLRYLRRQGIEMFHTQLDELWEAEELHRHLRSVIVTFVAGLDEPSAADARWVVRRCGEDEWRARTLRQLRNPRWFSFLQDTIENVMQRNDGAALSVSSLLAKLAPEQPEQVLALLRKHWLTEARVRALQFRLRDFEEVSGELIDTWIETTAFASCDWYMISGFFKDRPGNERYAAAVMGTYVAKRLADVAPNLASLSPGFERRHLIEQALYGIELPPGITLLRGFSGVFLRRIWDGLRLLLQLEEPSNQTRWRSYIMAPHEFRSDRSSLPRVVWDACVNFAETDPVGFIAFARSHGHVDLGSLQVAVCVGLRALGSAHPDLAVDLLIEEPRRLMLRGRNLDDEPRLSRSVIEVAAQSAAPKQLERLADTIVALRPSADIEERFQSRYREQLDLRDAAVIAGLLDAIPQQRRPRAALAWFEAHEEPPEELRWWTRAPRSRMASFIDSPYSSKDFAEMTPDQVIKVFRELPDDTEWHHPRNRLTGGSIQASRELAKALALAPERAEELFVSFEPKQQELPIAFTIREWANQDRRDLVLEWVRWANARGFANVRGEFGSALARIAEPGGLDDELCEMLELWLDEWVDEPEESEPEPEQWKPSEAVLGNGGGLIPQGSFAVLEALLFGLLYRTEPDVGRSRAAIERYWSMLATPLRFSAFGLHAMRLLLYFDQETSTRLVLRLLAKDISPLLTSASATPLIYLTSNDDQAMSLYANVAEQIRNSLWPRGPQAYAELAAGAALKRNSAWALDIVESVFEANERDERLFAGILHVATHHVIALDSDDERFTKAVDWLLRLLPEVSGLSSELSEVWLSPLDRASYADDLSNIARAHLPMFKAIALRPTILEKASSRLFIVARELVHEATSYVALFVKAFLEQMVENGRQPHFFDEEGDALITIIAMLQRKPHQLHHAHDILDLLITLNPYELESMLSVLEAGPASPSPSDG